MKMTPEMKATEKVIGSINNAMILIQDTYTVKDVKQSNFVNLDNYKIEITISLIVVLICYMIRKIYKFYLKRGEYQR